MKRRNTEILNNSELIKIQIRYRFIYSMVGLFLGLSCIAGGIFLFLNGVVGSSSWTASILGNESKITDAAPGAILFIIGLFFVIATRYKIRIENHEKTYRIDDDHKETERSSEADNHEEKLIHEHSIIITNLGHQSGSIDIKK